MAKTALGGNPVDTNGDLPSPGAAAPAVSLTGADLADVSLDAYEGKTKILNIFPSVDTSVCATSVRTFNEKAGQKDGVVVLNISADLPFAQKRFCGAEGLEGVATLSTFRSSFASDYGVHLEAGPMAGLCARAVVVVGPDNVVKHAELVSDIANEPNYDDALAALG
ncbi:MAG: thiol peroxidase [Sandaracinaceae bacterium]